MILKNTLCISALGVVNLMAESLIFGRAGFFALSVTYIEFPYAGSGRHR